MTVFGIVLAGGESRRMGQEKAFATLGAAPLIEHVIDRLRPQVADMAINAGGDGARFDLYALPVIEDDEAGLGPLGGVLAGLDWAAAEGAQWLLTVPADTPFLPRDLLAQLRIAQARALSPIVLAATPGEAGADLHPTLGLWHVRMAEPLRAALAAGTRKLRAFTGDHGAAEAVFDAPDAFFNVNTPEDLEAANAMLLDGAGR